MFFYLGFFVRNIILLLTSALAFAGSNNVVTNALPSVVNINAYNSSYYRDNSFGSGVIINAKNGYIVTNNHVIKGIKNIIVTLDDKRFYKAKLVGSDAATDLAVISIDANNLSAIPIAKQPVKVGDKTYAIGSPFQLKNTVTSGIVSGLDRTINLVRYGSFIQTDASLNPGNSGGALINEQGKLIGINTAIYSKSGANTGLSFAIPLSIMKPVVSQIIRNGHVKRGTLGIYIQDLNPILASALNLNKVEGVVVDRIVPNSNAENIGLKKFDIITNINGNQVNSSSKLQSQVAVIERDSKIDLDVIRDYRNIKIRGKLAKNNLNPPNNLFSGVKMAPTTFWSEETEQVKGVKILEVNLKSKAWMANLRPGDIIVSINKQPVKDMGQVLNFLTGSSKSLLLQVRKANSELLTVLR